MSLGFGELIPYQPVDSLGNPLAGIHYRTDVRRNSNAPGTSEAEYHGNQHGLFDLASDRYESDLESTLEREMCDDPSVFAGRLAAVVHYDPSQNGQELHEHEPCYERLEDILEPSYELPDLDEEQPRSNSQNFLEYD